MGRYEAWSDDSGLDILRNSAVARTGEITGQYAVQVTIATEPLPQEEGEK